MKRKKIALKQREGWKSVQEYMKDPATLQLLKERRENEHPAGFAEAGAAVSMDRRTFLALLSASMAVTATACRRPDYKLVPSVKSVEYQIPGVANYYTTVFQHGNAAYGAVVKTREGRPIHIDGNEEHPVTRGKSSALLQAQLLTLYDPDRMKPALLNERQDGSAAVLQALNFSIGRALANGKKAYLLIDEHCSPTLATLYEMLEQIDGLHVVCYPAIVSDNAAAANYEVLGFDGEFLPQLQHVENILTVDADILGSDKHWIFHTANFSAGRDPKKSGFKSLIAVESVLSLTGANADRRIVIHPTQYELFLAELLEQIAEKQQMPSWTAVARKVKNGESLPESLTANVAFAANYLLQEGKRSVVLLGSHLSKTAQLLGIALNHLLGSFGSGKVLDPNYSIPNSYRKLPGIQQFLSDLENGNVQTVVFLNTNPYYYGDRAVKTLLDAVQEKYACSLYYDETAEHCNGFIPAAHFLEHWDDAVAFDGTVSLQQPIIAPLNADSLDLPSVVYAIAKEFGTVSEPTFFDHLQARWERIWETAENGAETFTDFWISVLQKGSYSSPKLQEQTNSLKEVDGENVLSAVEPYAPSNAPLVCSITPSYALYDGKYANNAWLMELPDPITKIVWDNVALMSHRTAEQLGVRQEDVIEIETAAGKVKLPVVLQAGMVDGVIHTTIGYGREGGGVVAQGKGANCFAIIDRETTGSSIGYIPVAIKRLGTKYPVATTQNHFLLEGRPIILETTLSRVEEGNEELIERVEVPGKPEDQPFAEPPSIVAEYEYEGHRWAMVIDLTKCTGCSACVIACQAENNIPTVGKHQVLAGREMHWIRLDLYYIGDLDNPEVAVQPMLCQHCENAPCENVCPVAATVHSPEGLNEMVYNRCVGTRYCLNNCPYKVRRFNFLNYHTEKRAPIEMVFNPDVTVRMRGIMEKCTFCVQRINEGKWHAKKQGRDRVVDGEVRTACQQACPADAILFGDRNDPKSTVAQLWNDARGYWVLEEYNVRPQITYLAKVRNDKISEQLRETVS